MPHCVAERAVDATAPAVAGAARCAMSSPPAPLFDGHDQVVDVDPLIMRNGLQATSIGRIKPDLSPAWRLTGEEEQRGIGLEGEDTINPLPIPAVLHPRVVGLPEHLHLVP